DQVVDQAAQERDIRPGTNGRVIVGHRGSTGEAWIDHDQPGLVLGLGFGHPAETAGVCFSSVATHYQDQVGVADIRPGVGHGATAVRRGKTCHRRAVSDTCLVVESYDAEVADHLVSQVAGVVGRGRGGEKAYRGPAVDRLAQSVLLHEVGVAVLSHQAGDAIERFVPGQAGPLIGAGLAHHRVLQAVGALYEVQQAGALGAQAAAVDRMIRVTLDVDDLLSDVLAAAAAAVEDQSAAYRAVGAGVAGFLGVGQLEMPYRLG